MTGDGTIIIGAGQAGLAVSRQFADRGIRHVVLEARETLGGSWQDRWDSFCLVTPNFACRLPRFEYDGPDPDGYMSRAELIDHVRSYAASFDAPVELGARVTRLSTVAGGFELATTDGARRARRVIVATGAFQRPRRPSIEGRVPAHVTQLHTDAYRNPSSLPPGAVLVVGTGQSGAQIAEELLEAGRDVYLAVGSAGQVPRRYRGRDTTHWLFAQIWHGDEVGMPARTVADLPSPAGRFAPNPHVSGTKGGHDIHLRRLGADGVRLTGHLLGCDDGTLRFASDARAGIDAAERFFADFVRDELDAFIDAWDPGAPAEEPMEPAAWRNFAPEEVSELHLGRSGISTIVWASGYRPDFSWIDLPIFDEYGYPRHRRGVSEAPGLAFVGLPWLHNQASSLFAGVGADAAYLAGALSTSATSST